MPRGAFIVFEGVDKCGKTTQCQKTVASLSKLGINAKFLRFPDRTTPIGKVVDQYLQNKIELHDNAVHLSFAANRWEKMEEMKQELAKGNTLIVDRYSYSGVAFSAAKYFEDKSFESQLEWFKSPERGLLKPDCVLFMQLPLKEAGGRQAFGDERYENSHFQQKVLQVFQNHLMSDDYWKTIDANGTIEEVQQRVLDRVLPIIDECKDDKSFESLW